MSDDICDAYMNYCQNGIGLIERPITGRLNR